MYSVERVWFRLSCSRVCIWRGMRSAVFLSASSAVCRLWSGWMWGTIDSLVYQSPSDSTGERTSHATIHKNALFLHQVWRNVSQHQGLSRVLSEWHPFTAEHPLALILTAPIHCRASIDSHSDGTRSLQSIYWLSFWRHPFTAEHLLTLILTAPIHCRASIDSHSDAHIHWSATNDSHSDGTHSLQCIYWLSFWRHPFTAENPLNLILTAPIHCSASIDSHSDGTHSLQRILWISFWRHPFTAAHWNEFILKSRTNICHWVKIILFLSLFFWCFFFLF